MARDVISEYLGIEEACFDGFLRIAAAKFANELADLDKRGAVESAAGDLRDARRLYRPNA